MAKPKIPKYNTSLPVLAITSDRKKVSVRYGFAHKHLKEVQYKWKYTKKVIENTTVGTGKKKKTVKTKHYPWFDGGTGSVRAGVKAFEFDIPDEALKISVSIKAVASEHTVKYTDSKGKKTSGNFPYFKADWKTKKIVVKQESHMPEVPTPSGEMISARVLRCTVDNIDADATHIEYWVLRPAQYGTKIGNDPSGLVPVTHNEITGRGGWDKTIAYPGYGYQVKARAYNQEFKVYSDWSYYTPILPNMIYTAPGAVSGLKAVKVSKDVGGKREDQIRASWSSTVGATSYQIQYTTDPNGWSNDSLTSSVETPGTDTTIYFSVNAGFQYYMRIRAISNKVSGGNEADRGPWSNTIVVVVGTKPSPPTTWSNRLSAKIGDPVYLYWIHNTTDGSSLTSSEVEYTDGKITVRKTVAPTIDNITGVNSSQGEYKLDTRNFADRSKIRWKVRTKGISDEWSDWSTEREISVYEPPKISVTITSDEEGNIEAPVITEFPFYIQCDATPSTQKAIGFYVSISPSAAYRKIEPDGTERWVNAGEEIYSEFFDFAPSDGVIQLSDYATIDGNHLTLKMTPDRISLVTADSLEYNVSASVSMNSGLTADNSREDGTIDSFATSFGSIDNYDVGGIVTLDEVTLTAVVTPYCQTAFVADPDVDYPEDFTPPDPEPIPDISLSVYRYEQDGSFTLIGNNSPSIDPVSFTDPHPALRGVVYRIVAQSDITGAIVYADLEPEDLEENGIVIQWDEEWQAPAFAEIYDEMGELVQIDSSEIEAWTGGMVILPANIDIQNTAVADSELVKYDGRKHYVDYYSPFVDETGTWTGQFPKSDKTTIHALRRLQSYAGSVYVREPSGLGYWANVKVDFPVNHLELVVSVTLNITRVEGGM